VVGILDSGFRRIQDSEGFKIQKDSRFTGFRIHRIQDGTPK
jgi:hypothetical protein